MRLSEWRSRAPAREAMTTKVLAVVEPVLAALGAGSDAECWVAWGEDPATRYTILAVAPAGLVTCHVRVNLPQEGPRASAKLARWNRVQLGELGIESQGAHRMLSFQVEGQILRGVDAEADAIAAFAIWLIAAVDGRPVGEMAPRPLTGRVPRASAKVSPARGTATVTAGAAAAKGRPPAAPKGRAGTSAATARPAPASHASTRRAG